MAPSRVRIPFRSSLATLVAALASGCDYGHQNVWQPVPPPPFDTWEHEPNDAAWGPDPIGPIAVGEGLIIGGQITALGPDLFDGFAFQSVQPCEIAFTLTCENPLGDLDLCVYDPQLGVYSFCFENGGTVENGSFTVPNAWTDFQLVVSSYTGNNEYRLDVACLPMIGTVSASTTAGDASAPSEKPARAVPMERYFERASEPGDEAGPRVIARGVALEIDLASGEVREAPAALLAAGN